MKMRIVVVAVAIGLMSFSQASAFNGNRAGFVIGGGAGVSPYSRWENNDAAGDKEQAAGGAFDFLIGYGWNRNNLLVWDVDGSFVKGDVYGVKSDVIQGFAGPTWYRYFGEPGRAVYLIVGMGFARFVYCPKDDDDCYSFASGECIRIGVGYEFARHFQVGATISDGLTYDGRGDEYGHTTFNVLVQGVAF